MPKIKAFLIHTLFRNENKEEKMLDEGDLNIDEIELLKNPVTYCDIEINSPITDEDIRYAQLEELLFKDYMRAW